MSLDCFELTKSHAKSSRIRRIQCENGLFLEVLCDGSLSGVKEGTTDYGMLTLKCYVCGLLLGGRGMVKVILRRSDLFHSFCLFRLYSDRIQGCLFLKLSKDAKLSP